MTWYAVRTAPGAQMPQRQFQVEDAPYSRKGYRIVPSLDPNISAIERALKNKGFRFYMPCEHVAIRDRRKTSMWTMRRFPILKGYVFVADVDDFDALEKLPGVVGAVGSKDTGEKYHLSPIDFMYLRTKEAYSVFAAEEQIELWKRQAESAQRKANAKKLAQLKKRFKVGSRVSVEWGKAIGRQATITGWTQDAHLQAIADGLDALGTLTMSTSDVRLVA